MPENHRNADRHPSLTISLAAIVRSLANRTSLDNAGIGMKKRMNAIKAKKMRKMRLSNLEVRFCMGELISFTKNKHRVLTLVCVASALPNR
jgi:hypothetical protein